jgi:hypothetical protein
MKKRYSLNPAVTAANRELIGEGKCFRVVYRNPLDGTMRVLIGSLTFAEASSVQAKWGDAKQPFFYMGPECAIEQCDGTPDGAVLASEADELRRAEKLAEARLGLS